MEHLKRFSENMAKNSRSSKFSEQAIPETIKKRKRFVSKWKVQEVVKGAVEEVGLVGATVGTIADIVRKLEGRYLPLELIEKALKDIEVYEYEDLVEEEYRQEIRRRRMGACSSMFLVLGVILFISSIYLGYFMTSLYHLHRFTLAGSITFGFLTMIFNAFIQKYVTWRGLWGLIIAFGGILLYLILNLI